MPLLDQLKDIHLPPAITWWPPAPGWWLLAALIVGLLWWVLRFALRRHRERLFSRQAKRQVNALWSHYQKNRDATVLVKSLLILARQTAKSNPLHEQLATVPTSDLLAIVDEGSVSKLSNAVELTQLHDLLYQPAPEELSRAQARQVFLCLRQWIRQTGGPLW